MKIMKGADEFSFKNKSDVGFLLIHGFTSTPDTMRYIGTVLNKKGFDVECRRLAGHGTKWQDLNKVSYRDWIDNVEAGLNDLKKRVKKVFVMGLSMGGTLTLRLGQLHPEINGLILVNHCIFMGNPFIFMIPVLKYIMKSAPAVGNDIKDTTKTELAYDKSPTFGAHELWKLTKVIKKDLDKLVLPTLIFKSKDDHILPLKNAPYTFEKISSENKKLIWLTNSYHVATMDYDKDKIVEESLKFVEDILSGGK